MKWRWRQRRGAAGLSTDSPNMVMGSNVQVVWEKFCKYWDVEARYVPVAEDRFVVDPDDVMEQVDENTIGVIPILGTTYTGEFEPIQEIHDRVVAYNAEHDPDIPIHVDAASGGFVAPFLHPDLEWDFRLAPGEVDQRVGPQVRAHLSRDRLRDLAFGRRPARGSHLPRQLPRGRHADLHAQLLPARQPDRGPVLQLRAPGPRGVHASIMESPTRRR